VKLIDNWAQSWRWLSMQCSAAVTTLSVTWIALPADIRTPQLQTVEEWTVAALGALAMFGRLVQQSPTPSATGDTP
jgi:hypothetical protein